MHFTSEEDLETHNRCHVRNCRTKGCKRQRPAYEQETITCNHLITAEQQWHEIFKLRYGRDAPSDVFSTTQSRPVDIQESHVHDSHNLTDVETYLNNATPSVMETPMSDIEAEVNQFYDEGYLRPVTDNRQPSSPPEFDIAQYVETPAVDNLYLTPSQTNESFNVSLHTACQPQFGPDSGDAPSQSVLETLQSQLKSLESKFESQVVDDRRRIFSLQSQNAHLEQKLFQSSEREKQLEALLGVVFDGYQNTGAQQAQPNMPLWKLVMSHISPAAPADGQRLSVTAATSSPPNMRATQVTGTTQEAKQAGERMMRSDSAYGSSR